MSFRNSVGARLMLSFAGIIVVFGVAVGVSIGRLATFNSAMTEITGPEFAKVETAHSWFASLSDSMRQKRNMLLLVDKTQIQGEIVRARDLIGKRSEYRESLTTAVQSPEGKALLQKASDASA